MFVDPLHTVSVSLPPGWAFDPTASSLTRLAFLNWTSPEKGPLFVLVSPSASLVAPGKSDGEWEMAVRSRLPAEARRVERRAGPVVFVEVPERTEPLSCRVAWLRGPRLDVLIEQHGVPHGGALGTPELEEALRTLKVPVNHRIVHGAPQRDWAASMDAAARARATDDDAAVERHLRRAQEIATDAWLHGLIGNPSPDVVAATAHADATLKLAMVGGSVEHLYRATTTLYRCRLSRISLGSPRTAVDYRIDDLTNQALELHGVLKSASAPKDPFQACLVRSYLFQLKLASLLESGPPRVSGVSWVTASGLATAATEDAMTAVALARLAATRRYSDLPGEVRAELAGVGVDDEMSFQKEAHEAQVRALDYLVSAGRGLSAVTLAAVSVSAKAMKENVCLAGRALAKLAPSPERDRALVDLINGYASSLVELGDEPSLDEARRLLAEAQAILDRLGDEGSLRASVCCNEAYLCLKQKRFSEGLVLVDRAIALARAGSVEGTEGLSRACRSRLLNLAGRHEEALAEARRALAIMIGSNHRALSAVHETLAIANYHAGNPEAGLEEIRAGLAVALVDNPVGDAVQHLLSTAARILEESDPAASSAAREAAATLFEARRTDVGGVAERIAYDDAAHHRELAASVVERRLDAHDALGALAAADRYRARSLVDIAGLTETPREGVPYTPPADDASFSVQIASVVAAARAFVKNWGFAPPLDGAALSTIASKHGRTVVLFHPTDTTLLVFVIRPGPTAVIETRIGATSISNVFELTDELRKQLGIVMAGRAARGHLPPQSFDEAEAAMIADNVNVERADAQLDQLRVKLHDALFSEVLPLLQEQEPIVVVPYRELSVIPLGVLTAADGRPLIERHPVSILPSLSSLGFLAQPVSASPFGVVVGDPLLPSTSELAQLKGAAEEARQIRDMLISVGINTIPLIGADATEEEFRNSAAGARVVHLACHAALREPASASPLFLTPAQYDDGLLLSEEIADLDLDGALVVLAACQSGLGRATADGVLGLGRAFMQAGARVVVLSLWWVGDAATAFLMHEFYQGLLGLGRDCKGQRLDVAAAMQRAQLATRKELFRHPGAWGPWLVVGDGGWKLG